MTQFQIRSKMAENQGQAEGILETTFRMLNTSNNIDTTVIKQTKLWLREALDLFKRNDTLHKDLIRAIEAGE